MWPTVMVGGWSYGKSETQMMENTLEYLEQCGNLFVAVKTDTLLKTRMWKYDSNKD